MLHRLALPALAALAAAACASAPSASGPAPSSSTAASSTASSAAFTPTLNIAATSSWAADERLMPQDPILALIDAGGSVGAPAGFSTTCNPDNGAMTARLGKQSSTRVGQSATFQMRVDGKASMVEGKFEANAKSPDADFVFPIKSADLRGMAAANQVSFQTDGGELQWAFVKDPAATVSAKYIASLKGLPAESQSYIVYCNPK
jgi:hypothetical protein